MNTYDKLEYHLDTHQYTRGQYKGDAPADKSKRGRSHHRVVQRSQFMAIRFHNTDIVRAYPDGRVMIDCNGWVAKSTTAMALRDAALFMPFHYSVFNRSIMSLSQTVLRTRYGTMVKYYDGITMDGEGKVITPLRPFEARRIDKAESKEFMDAVEASGFKDMFKLLYATVQPTYRLVLVVQHRRLSDILTDPEHAADWPHIIAKYKYEQRWLGIGGKRGWVEVGSAQTCWSRIMSDCKRSMYNTVSTEVVSIK
jgi:hypothetical protein